MVMEFHSESFRGIARHDCEAQMRVLNRYSAPLPWIGMYIAAASLVCEGLMFADLVYAIRWRKFWFPCKYFTLNAATLTLLGVVVKLLLDISSPMATDSDKFAKYCNHVLLLTIMASFSTSLCSMDGKSLVSNMIALFILAVTVIGNIIIQVKTGLVIHVPGFGETEIISSIVLLFEMLIGLALVVHVVKSSTEAHYRQKYEMVLNEEREREGKLTSTRLELVIKKLWIIAVTSSPPFVLGSFLWVFLLVPVWLNIKVVPSSFIAVLGFKSLDFGSRKVGSIFPSSEYSWSIIWIVTIQSIGYFTGLLSFLMRLIAIIFRLNSKPLNTERVLTWRSLLSYRNPLQLEIASLKCWKLFSRFNQYKIIFIHVVIFRKISGMCILLIQFILVLLELGISLCYSYIVKLKEYVVVHRIDNSSVQTEEETELNVELAHLAGYAYDRAIRLSKMEINMIYFEQRQLIQTGKRKQPKNLFQLLQRSKSFIGVSNFDHIQVPSLHIQETPSCWTLPVMTLAKIAVALPQESNETFDSIIKSVTEGLKYADLVDRSLEAKRDLQNIRNTVKVIWLAVELDHKWLKVKPIMRTSQEAKLSKEILQDLADSAKNRVDKYNKAMGGGSLMDHTCWPLEVVAANSMSRICSTLLLDYDEEGKAQTTAGDDDGLLEKLLDMIADILSACLTNLPHVMVRESDDNTIGKAEDRARQVARWFGECEEILKLLESREVPQMDPEKALCIDEWQAFFSQGNAYDSTPIPNNVNASPLPEEEHVSNASPSQEEEHVPNASPRREEAHVSTEIEST